MIHYDPPEVPASSPLPGPPAVRPRPPGVITAGAVAIYLCSLLMVIAGAAVVISAMRAEDYDATIILLGASLLPAAFTVVMLAHNARAGSVLCRNILVALCGLDIVSRVAAPDGFRDVVAIVGLLVVMGLFGFNGQARRYYRSAGQFRIAPGPARGEAVEVEPCQNA